MILSKQDAALFFELWLPLLRFGSEAYDLHAGKLVKPSGGIDFEAALEVAEAIWKDVSIIDDYLSLSPEMKPEERSPLEDRIALFMSLFQGRQDVCARRWESRNGRAGYSPACKNEWRKGVCLKPKGKCAECAYAA